MGADAELGTKQAEVDLLWEEVGIENMCRAKNAVLQSVVSKTSSGFHIPAN